MILLTVITLYFDIFDENHDVASHVYLMLRTQLCVLENCRFYSLKSVCQAIPTYSMSCFKLSKKLCKKFTSVVACFFWGGEMRINRNALEKWKELAIPKANGGLEFRDFITFKQSLLAK